MRNYPDYCELFDDINEDTVNKIADVFLLQEGPLKVEELAHDKLTLININTKLRTMAYLPTTEDRIKTRIKILTDEKNELEDFVRQLDMNKEDELRIIIKETSTISRNEVIIDEYTKFLNNEV